MTILAIIFAFIVGFASGVKLIQHNDIIRNKIIEKQSDIIKAQGKDFEDVAEAFYMIAPYVLEETIRRRMENLASAYLVKANNLKK